LRVFDFGESCLFHCLHFGNHSTILTHKYSGELVCFLLGGTCMYYIYNTESHILFPSTVRSLLVLCEVVEILDILDNYILTG